MLPVRLSVTAKLAIEAAGLAEATAIADEVLAAMDASPAQGRQAFTPVNDHVWFAEFLIDTSDWQAPDPGDPLGPLSYLTRELEQIPWLRHDNGREARLEWPPSIFATMGKPGIFVHKSVIGVQLSSSLTDPGR